MSRLRVIAVAGGKGGVGKTQVAVNLAVIMADRGLRVLLIDGDLTLSNADLLLDVRPAAGLVDVGLGRVPIEDALTSSAYGVTLLSGAHGEVVGHLGDREKLALLGALDSLGEHFDAVLVDTASGLSSDGLFFAGAAEEVLVVTTPEPTALADTYATIRALAKNAGQRKIALVVNQAADASIACEVHERLGILTRRFLGLDMALAGWIPFDVQVHAAVMRRSPVVASAGRSPASRALRYIADHVLGQPVARASDLASVKPGIQFFWRHLLGYARVTTAEER
ncbi:MAG: P-loop NTPase [Myxococcota bacterium]